MYFVTHSIAIGLLILRVGIGIIFIIHGYPKLLAGTAKWLWLGQQMKLVGITFLPVVWGFIAACTEFFGGIALVTGCMTRYASFLLAFMLFIAVLFHINAGDSWNAISHPLALLVVFIAITITGAGIYSVDSFLLR